MEKVWIELKKIEAQADQIRSQAQNKAKEITALAQQEAEELLANSKIYAQEDAEKVYNESIKQASHLNNEKLLANRQAENQLKSQARKQMEEASEKVVNVVLGEKAT
jgi:hypothetical protein